MMVCPGVAPVPVRVGVLSSVVLPLVNGPCTEPTSSVTLKAGDVGALGACVSSVTVKLAVLVLPVCAVTSAI